MYVRPAELALRLLGLERQGALAGRSVLDVGCGTGFIGILAQKAGCAESVLSDRPGRALSTARINALANSGRDPDTIQVRELSWGPGSVDETEGAVYSLLLLSEVLYVAQPTCVPWSLDEEDVEALAKLTKLKLSPEGDAYITYGNLSRPRSRFCSSNHGTYGTSCSPQLQQIVRP